MGSPEWLPFMKVAASIDNTITTYRFPTKDEYWQGVRERWSYTAWSAFGAINGLNIQLSFGIYNVFADRVDLDNTQSGLHIKCLNMHIILILLIKKNIP